MARFKLKSQIKEIDTKDLIYLAGFIDGEGTISILRNNRSEKRKRDIEYRPYLSVSNTNKEVLDWIVSVSGVGKVYREKVASKACKNPTRGFWKYYLMGTNAIAFANLLLPYLRIKRLQAEILLNYGKTIIRENLPYRVPENIWLERKDLMENVKKLNQRGENSLIN